jgi:putative membrane protein
MRSLHRSATLLVMLPLLVAAGCHRGAAENSAPLKGPRVSDRDIVAIVLAANNTDLSYARMVPARARSTEVLQYAQRMATDHTILNMRANDVAERNRIRAEDNEISLAYRDYSAANRDKLRDLSGAKFDSAYVANEVLFHADLLAALNEVLGPQAKNGELRELVMNLKPAVTAHLAHAEQLQASLNKKR